MIDLLATVLVRSERQAFKASVMVLLDKVWTLHEGTWREDRSSRSKRSGPRVYQTGYSCISTKPIGQA